MVKSGKVSELLTMVFLPLKAATFASSGNTLCLQWQSTLPLEANYARARSQLVDS